MANQPVESVTYIPLLQKPAQTDTTFWIRADLQSTTDITFNEVAFQNLHETSEAVFYVQSEEVDRIGSSTLLDFINQLKEPMFNSTPNGLYNPDQGFYYNEVELFGEPTDVDNNNKIFILLLDIEDAYTEEAGGSYVAGYFDPLDLSSTTGENGGNHSEILYIDTDPGLSQNFKQTITTAAHELQHLLHAGADPNENTWLNEGMSEVTAHLFGLQARPFSFFLENPNRTLTRFEYDDENVVADYAKVGLWTLYLYTQFGTDFLKNTVRNTQDGISSINTELSQANTGLTFTEVYSNWTVATVGHNLLPASAATARYRYDGFSIPPVEPALTISQFPAIAKSAQIKNLSMSYIRFFGGENLDVQFSAPTDLTVDGTLILSDGTNWDVIPNYDLSSGNPNFSEYSNYNDGWFVVSSPTVASDEERSISGVYDITVYGSGGQIVETIDYTSDDIGFFLTLGGGTAAVTFNELDPQSRFIKANFNLLKSDPVTVELRESFQGDSIASHTFENPTFGSNTWILDSLNITGSSLLVLVTSDSNALQIDTTSNDPRKSFFSPAGQQGFAHLDEFQINGNDDPVDLQGNWEMSVQVSYPGLESDTETGPILARSNPWILSSELHGSDVVLTLLFEEPGEVRLDVFNVLGQHVESLYNQNVTQADRAFQVRWDGTNKYGVRVSSGLYFFAVQKDGDREVRKLSLIW